MADRPSGMPEANKMARMLRSGRTTGDLALRYGIASTVIITQLTSNGWDASTGAWVGGDKKDYTPGAPPLAVRGGGPGQSGHHVGGGDNPNVVPTATRPFTQRRRPTGFAWPPPVNSPVAPVPPKRRPNGTRKIGAEVETELVQRYLDGEIMVTLAHEYGVSERTVRKRLVALGVPVRGRSEALRLRYAQARAKNTDETFGNHATHDAEVA